MANVPDAQSDGCSRGEAEVRIFNFKTTGPEFQKPSQTAAEQGKTKLRILIFKITWSDTVALSDPYYDR